MRLRSLLLALPLLFVHAPANAQMLPFGLAIEARAGLATPVGAFADSEDQFTAESGMSYAVGGRVSALSSFGIFAGYQRTDFDCEQCAQIALDDSVTLEGLEAGVDLGLPLATLPISPWLRAGIIYQQLVFSGFDGERASDPSVGFSGGLGLSIPVLGLLEIMPAVRYFTVPAEYTFDGGLRDGSADVSALTADVGVAVTF